MTLDRIGVQHAQEAVLLEVDVSHARRLIRIANRGAECAVSLIAWLVGCVARTLHENPDTLSAVPGMKKTSDPDITVSLLVDRHLGSHRIPVPVALAGAQKCSIGSIQSAIEHARSAPADEANLVVGKSSGFFAACYRRLPGAIRRMLLLAATRNRRHMHRVSGSVLISSPGMGGRIRGWFIPSNRHPICVGIGAVTPKATVINGRIESREVLHISILMDSRVIGAKPASRWISDLVRFMESAKNLQIS